jgi:arylsulfatase
MKKPDTPNILYFHVDNIGLGELSCYNGPAIMGAETNRIDEFAKEGLQSWHFIAEAQCTPSRSALMTGREPIRSGTHTVTLGDEEGGIVAWEKTMGDQLSEAGYATACIGKWHIGAEKGRWPTDHGFDEFYGPARSYDECMWDKDPFYDPKVCPPAYIYEGKKGQDVKPVQDKKLTYEVKKNIDLEYLERAKTFMTEAVKKGKPFYLYYNPTLMHVPLEARKEFKNKSRHGDHADCLLQLDHDFGVILNTLKKLEIEENTIVVFAGDNGPEEMILHRGDSGQFEGSYFASGEGGVRTPFIIRWPKKVKPGKSNEMLHITDMYPTLLKWADAEVPQDRIIDGIDQRSFFEGKKKESNRDGCILFVGPEIHAVKWRNFKLRIREQKTFFDPVLKLGFPKLVNLITDPKEREPIDQKHFHSWVMAPASKILKEYLESLKKEPPVPADSPVDYVPKKDNVK